MAESMDLTGILNWDTPKRVPLNAEPSSPDVSLASASLIFSKEEDLLKSTKDNYIQKTERNTYNIIIMRENICA